MMRPLLPLAIAALLAGCADLAQGPSLAGYPGLGWQLESYYGPRALEQNATCTTPRMTPIAVQVVEDTPTRLVLNVRYNYSNALDIFPTLEPWRFGPGTCNGTGVRTFVVAKSVGGPEGAPQALSVSSMTGPQRELPPNSAMR